MMEGETRMDRRSFLKVMLAAASAPAIVRADSLMKIWVPPTEALIVYPENAKLTEFELFLIQHVKDVERAILFGYPNKYTPNPFI